MAGGADLTGSRGTLNITAEQREIDMSDTIALLEPEASPLTLFSKKAGKKRAISPKFSWLEDASEPRFDAVNGAVASTTTKQVTVDNGAYFAEHFLVENTTTAEYMRVESVAGNVVTFVRGVGSTAVNIGDNDELLIIGVAQPEGDTSRPARSSNPSVVTNYTQILREPWDETETLRSSDVTHEPHDWDYTAKYKGIEHAKDIEYTLLFGRSSENTDGSQPRRTTKGAVPFITTNSTNASGAFSNTELNTALRSGFRYGSKKKMAFGSSLAISVINDFAQGKLETRTGENTFGLAISSLVSPFGRLDVQTHWLLEGAKYGGYLVGLDMETVRYRYLAGGVGKNRDTFIKTNIQENDRDGRKDEYISECGLELGSEKRHFLVTGITS